MKLIPLGLNPTELLIKLFGEYKTAGTTYIVCIHLISYVFLFVCFFVTAELAIIFICTCS